MSQNIETNPSKSEGNKYDTDLELLLRKIHDAYFRKIEFKQIDYIVGEPLPGMIQQPRNQLSTLVFLSDKCLLITQKAYDLLYGFMLKVVINESAQDHITRHKAAQILLAMNGENDKAYNLKKIALSEAINDDNKEGSLIKQKNKIDVQRQLALNGAVIMRNKKSSACYEYRFRLIELNIMQAELEANQKKQKIQKIFAAETSFCKQVLNRYTRNYFCWMYRLRIFKIVYRSCRDEQLILNEMSCIDQMLQKNPNDYSALSYYRYLIRLHMSQYPKSIKSKCLQKCKELLQFCKVAYETEDCYKRLAQFVTELEKLFSE